MRGCQEEACLVVAGSEMVVGSVLAVGCVCMKQVSQQQMQVHVHCKSIQGQQTASLAGQHTCQREGCLEAALELTMQQMWCMCMCMTRPYRDSF